MNGAIYDSTFNIFFKLRYAKTYDAILSTPLAINDIAVGEITWALIRGDALRDRLPGRDGRARPGRVALGDPGPARGDADRLRLRGGGHGGHDLVRSWTDFDYIFVVTLPLFLFSSTFYPLSVYPEPLRTIVSLTPLSRCIDLLRSLALGESARSCSSTSPTCW